MAGLFLSRDPRAVAQARPGFAANGFTRPSEHVVAGWTLLHWPYIRGGPALSWTSGADLVAVAGTIAVDGATGRDALAALATMDPLAPDWERIGGQFVAVIAKAGRAFVLTDWIGAFQLFHDRERSFFSTSLLGALSALPRVSFDPLGVYELAFNVMPLGEATVFEQLATLSPRVVIELTPDGTVAHAVARARPSARTRMPLEARLAGARAALDRAIAPHVAAFGDRIHCPLSGGLDSRLLLAALRAHGARPDVYVYGPPNSADVTIARLIGERLDFPVTWIEKERHAPDPDAFAGIVARNFAEMDALPTFGNIFDDGSNLAARDARHAGGALAASGGGGEVYRDFFYLPDRRYSPRAVAETFYARFTDRDVTAAFDRRAFLDRVSGAIADALGAGSRDERLPRVAIDAAYPLVRCRALFGREISLEARQGAYLMPFLDHRLVADALTIPHALRPAGRFEAQLLAAIDPALAALPSAYGHDFAGLPSRAHRFGEWSSRVRPVALRRMSYAIQRRLRPAMSDEHGGLMAPGYLHRVIDADYPAMRRFFRIDRITDTGLLRRVANLEYLAGWLGSKLVG